jgi:porphobilinogen synthase
MPLPVSASFPDQRLRRLRGSAILRSLVRETELNSADFIMPLFIREGNNIRNEITSMPGIYQHSIDAVKEIVDSALNLGIRSFLLFGIPATKDPEGRVALQEDGIVQKAVRSLKREYGQEVILITDECFCEYTTHGHCGILKPSAHVVELDNDSTLKLLVQQCVSHAQSGVDMVAPSGMLDGMVSAIRRGLDEANFSQIPIMSYSAKYASAFYGPFREAAESPPQFGDRTSYQMDPANALEALRETSLDLQEGADIVMVKPALSYLDMIQRIKSEYRVPTAAYNVSGEYAMVKSAAKNGWIDGRKVTLEILTSIKRAGADMIITYHAIEASQWLKQG